MAIDPYANCNYTIPDNSLCTLQTCCLAQSSFNYLPSYGGNLFFAVYFGILIVPQIALGIYYRTWGFMIGMVMGLVLEIIGYVARVQLHNSPFDSNPFLMYLITLTIAPVFMSAAIYLCLTRIIVLYGQQLSRFLPRTIACTFMSFDFLALVLQAIGGAIADTATAGTSEQQTGVDIMIAGLFLQAMTLGGFILLSIDFIRSCRKGVVQRDEGRRRMINSMAFKAFLAGLALATVAVLTRSIFRVAELWGGFNGSLWNDEIDFMVLDGAMIALASLTLTALHPGLAFRDQWRSATWSFKKTPTHIDLDASQTSDVKE